MTLAGGLIEGLLWFFIALLWIRFVVDWVQIFARSWTPRGVLLVALEGVFTITDPPILAFRRIFKPLRLGGIALDLSPLIVLIICSLLIQINTALWA